MSTFHTEVVIFHRDTNLETLRQRHSFHILPPSSFPSKIGLSLGLTLLCACFYMHGACLYNKMILHATFIIFWVVLCKWFYAVIVESAAGYHTKNVRAGLRAGVVLFIVSEIMFFFAFFWAFVHLSSAEAIATGAWPAVGTQYLDPLQLPLVNTMLLLLSGVMITGAHHTLCVKQYNRAFLYLFLTIVLGVTFLMCQFYEYKYGVQFSWKGNIFGSIFFMMTGFHGLHVTIGTLFLVVCLARLYLGNIYTPRLRRTKSRSKIAKFLQRIRRCNRARLSASQHVGLEAAAWYWHFVDVVWLALYLLVYVWGQWPNVA